MKLLPLAAAAAALLGAAQAHAAGAGCKLATQDIPVTMRGLRPIVSAKIAGQPVNLIIDSGAFFSTLDGKVAAKLQLKPVGVETLGSHIPVAGATLTSGVAGKENLTSVVSAPSFEFAGAKFSGMAFLTGPIGDAAGLVGQNLLHQLDNEYDLSKGVMRLVKPTDCDQAMLAYWLKPGEAYSMAELQPTSRYDAHSAIIVEVNGARMRAYLDTGADTSFITAHAAARAGVRTTDPGVKPAGYSHGLDGAVKTWTAPFASIKIGDEEIKNTQLAIGASEATDFDILIGADFFMAHHVYVANSQGKVYFTYSGGRVFRVSDPDEAVSGGEGHPAK